MTQPPSGYPPPLTAELQSGETLDLRDLAREICRRYRSEFPDEQERYGEAGMAWCLHDNQYILSWAVTECNGYGGLERQLTWLAGVLEARDFPLERLVRDLEIASDVLSEASGESRLVVSETLAEGARLLRSRAGAEKP